MVHTETAQSIITLSPDFVRIYPTIVIANTILADMYSRGSYKELSLYDGIVRAGFLKLHFDHHKIPVIRTGLQATEDLDKSNIVLAGPYHPAFGEMVDSYIFYIMLAHCVEFIISSHITEQIIIHHHSRDTSKVRGISNKNIKTLQRTYNMKAPILKGDGANVDEIIFEYKKISYVVNKKMLVYI